SGDADLPTKRGHADQDRRFFRPHRHAERADRGRTRAFQSALGHALLEANGLRISACLWDNDMLQAAGRARPDRKSWPELALRVGNVVPCRALVVHEGAEEVLAYADPDDDGAARRTHRADEGQRGCAIHLRTVLKPPDAVFRI